MDDRNPQPASPANPTPSNHSARRRVSLVLPVGPDQPLRPGLWDQASTAAEAVAACGYECEIVFVENGSGSEALQTLREWASEQTQVRLVELSRSFGPHAAAEAGRQHASGEAVISFQAPCPQPVELVRQMLTLWKEGAEVICAQPAPQRPAMNWRASLRVWLQRSLGRRPQTPPADVPALLLDRSVLEALRPSGPACWTRGGAITTVGFRQRTVPWPSAGEARGAQPVPARQGPENLGLYLAAASAAAGLVGLVVAVLAAVTGGVLLAVVGLLLVAQSGLNVLFAVAFDALRAAPREPVSTAAPRAPQGQAGPYVIRQISGFQPPAVEPQPQRPQEPAEAEPADWGIRIWT